MIGIPRGEDRSGCNRKLLTPHPYGTSNRHGLTARFVSTTRHAITRERSTTNDQPHVRNHNAVSVSCFVTTFRDGGDPGVRACKTAGTQGARSRAIDVDVRLEALVDGVAIAGRQKVDYGGYGGMTVRMNPNVREFSIRAVHPNPDKWQGDDLGLVQRVTDPAAFGDAAWMAIYGKYPAAGIEAPAFTTVMMFESKASPLFPNSFRYYGSSCISLAFPGRTILPLAKGKPLDYRTRFVICEGKTTIEQEKTVWRAYQR